MLFSVVRILLFVIILLICYFVIKKKIMMKERSLRMLSIFVAVIFIFVFSFIANAFISFSSPESAYRYSQNADVKLVVTGNTSDFVIGEKGDKYVLAAVPKENAKWKVGLGSYIKIVSQFFSDDVSISVYQYKNTEEYYIVVFGLKGEELTIFDNRNSSFYTLNREASVVNKTYYSYYAYVNAFDEQYIITVNGKLICMDNVKK